MAFFKISTSCCNLAFSFFNSNISLLLVILPSSALIVPYNFVQLYIFFTLRSYSRASSLAFFPFSYNSTIVFFYVSSYPFPFAIDFYLLIIICLLFYHICANFRVYISILTPILRKE